MISDQRRKSPDYVFERRKSPDYVFEPKNIDLFGIHSTLLHIGTNIYSLLDCPFTLTRSHAHA